MAVAAAVDAEAMAAAVDTEAVAATSPGAAPSPSSSPPPHSPPLPHSPSPPSPSSPSPPPPSFSLSPSAALSISLSPSAIPLVREMSVATDMSNATATSRIVSTPPGSAPVGAMSAMGDTAPSVRVDEDGFGIKGYLSMRDQGVTYHRMKRYYCRFVGVNFYRFYSLGTANALINATFAAEIERIVPWDGRGLLHTYRNAFKLYFTNGVVFNIDADNEEDKLAWIKYAETAIEGAAASAMHWESATKEDRYQKLLALSRGGLSFVDERVSSVSPKFKNQPTCGHPACSARFDSAKKRQHHCRNCGGSMCSDHSSRFAVLRHYRQQYAVRLCTRCYRVQRFIMWLDMLVQRLCIAQVAPVQKAVLSAAEQEEVDALEQVLSDSQLGISDVIQVLHLHRFAPDEGYVLAINKLLTLSMSNLTDFEFFLPQIFHMWLTLDWTAHDMKAAMLFRVVSYAAQVHVRFATSIYWLARAAVDDSCGWGFGQSELLVPDYLYRKLSMCKLLIVNLELQIIRQDREFTADEDLPACEMQADIIRCLFDRMRVLLNAQSSRPSISHGPICEAIGVLALPSDYIAQTNVAIDAVSDMTAAENRRVFQTQVQFIRTLCDMTERLRLIEPRLRKAALKEQLAGIELPESAFCPLGSCEDALLRFVTIARDEGTVFTTRARAPTLVFFEVERMSSFNNQNTWLQRANGCYWGLDSDNNPVELGQYGADGDDECGNVEGGVSGDGAMTDEALLRSMRTKNAIEMATSSAIAQALPPNALDDNGDDRSSEAYNNSILSARSRGRRFGKRRSTVRSSIIPLVEEGKDSNTVGPLVDAYNDEGVNGDDEDDDGEDPESQNEDNLDDNEDDDIEDSDGDDDEDNGDDDGDEEERCDEVSDVPPVSFTATESASKRRRSGSLINATRNSLDTLMSVCVPDRYNDKRKRSVSEGNEKELEAWKASTPLRNEFEMFTVDQLTSVAQNLELTVLSDNPAGHGVFTGQDVLDWMTKTEIVSNLEHAHWLAQELLRVGVVERADVPNQEAGKFSSTAGGLYRLSSMSTTISLEQSSAKTNSFQSNRHHPDEKPSDPSVPESPKPTQAEPILTPDIAASASPKNCRIISPRRKQGIDSVSIVDAVGENLSFVSTSGVAVDVIRGSTPSDRSSIMQHGANDEQRSIASTNATSSVIDKFQPEVTAAAMNSIEAAMERYVFSQANDETADALRQDLRSLREQLEVVSEFVVEHKKKRQIAVESAFGESFEEKKERLRKSSRHMKLSRTGDWDCVAFIVKSFDDLRQEVLCLQLIRQFQDIFQAAELPLRLLPYRIIATSASTGMIEYIKNATSLDGLKKSRGYTTLANHFIKTYGDLDSEPYKTAMANFVRSMAAYSLVSYFLQIKDRHNGNIMIDSDGHVVHIDFGFILGIAPGGRFSLETAPFKLTTEMVAAMGGTQSEYFKAYVILLIQGFLALQQHADTVLLMIAIMAQESSCPCFLSQNPRDLLTATKQRFKLHMNQTQVIKYVLGLVRRSHNSYRTRQYDVFQKLTNGILP